MKTILLASLPILIMIALLPLIESEMFRAGAFILIAAGSFFIMKASKLELSLFVFGFAVMSFFEYIFVATHVEAFTQRSYLGAMPLWLPILWGYSFVAIKRGIKAIEAKF